MDERVRSLLAATQLHVPEEAFVLVRLPAAAYPSLLMQLDQAHVSGFLSLIRSAEETTLLTSESIWAQVSDAWPQAVVESGWRLITLEQEVALDVVGYLAPLAQALAAADIPLLVISAFSTDHLLVQEHHLPAALKVLQRVIDEAAQAIPSND